MTEKIYDQREELYELEKSSYIPTRLPPQRSSEGDLPYEKEAISLMVRLGVQNWGRPQLAMTIIALKTAFEEGRRRGS
jgi:hypothetical protein